MTAKEFMRIYHKLEEIAMNDEEVKKELFRDNMFAELGDISLKENVFIVNIETFHYGEPDFEILVKIPVQNVIGCEMSEKLREK